MGNIIAVLLLTGLQVTRAADDGRDATANGQMDGMPRLRLRTDEDYYPPSARRSGAEGRVLLAFDITPAGTARNISVIWAENTVFVATSVRSIARARFDVPADWASLGAARRWRVGFTYCLPPSPQSDAFAVPVGTRIQISGSRLPGTPVPKLPLGFHGPCAP